MMYTAEYKPKFCRQCGASLKEEETGLYDVDTGAKETHLVCSEAPCAHNGCKYVSGRCIRCRREAYTPDW